MNYIERRKEIVFDFLVEFLKFCESKNCLMIKAMTNGDNIRVVNFAELFEMFDEFNNSSKKEN